MGVSNFQATVKIANFEKFREKLIFYKGKICEAFTFLSKKENFQVPKSLEKFIIQVYNENAGSGRGGKSPIIKLFKKCRRECGNKYF